MTMAHDSNSHVGQVRNKDHWLAQATFGLFVAGLMLSLVALYWSGPVDF